MCDNSEDRALIDLAGRYTPEPSDGGVLDAVGSSTFPTVLDGVTSCPFEPEVDPAYQLHNPISPDHLTCPSLPTSQPSSDNANIDCILNDTPSKKRAISSRSTFGLGPLALAIQSRRSLSPGERKEAQTKKRLMQCQQGLMQGQAEIKRLQGLLEGEKRSRVEQQEARKREMDRRIRAEVLLTEKIAVEEMLRREKVALEGQLELVSQLWQVKLHPGDSERKRWQSRRWRLFGQGW